MAEGTEIKKNRDMIALERSMPHNIDLELEAISLIIDSPSYIHEEYISKLDDYDFFAYREVWKFVTLRARKKEAITIGLIGEHLSSIGADQLTEHEKGIIFDSSDSDTEELVTKLKKYRTSRAIVEATTEATRHAYANKPNKSMNMLYDLRKTIKNIEKDREREKTSGEIAQEVENFLFSPDSESGMVTDVPVFDRQLDMLTGGFPIGVVTSIYARPSMGKALRNDQRVLTNNGWVLISKLNMQDHSLVGSDGKTHSLIGIYPQGKKKMMTVTFDDRSQVVCSEDHLWTIHAGDDKFRTVETSELPRLLNLAGRQYYLPPAAMISGQYNSEYTKNTLYLLGVFAARGSIDENNGEIRLTTHKKEVAKAIAKMISEEYAGGTIGITNKSSKHGLTWYSIYLSSDNAFSVILNKIKKSMTKNEDHQIRDITLRRELTKMVSRYTYLQKLYFAQGLIDICGAWQDGGIYLGMLFLKGTGENSAKRLKYFVSEHFMSLGFKCTTMRSKDDAVKIHHAWSYSYLDDDEKQLNIHEIDGYTMAPALIRYDSQLVSYAKRYCMKVIQSNYRNPFKSFPYRKRIISAISSVNQPEAECTCLAIDSEDQLFITEGYSLTHNTRFLVSSAIYAALWAEKIYPGQYFIKYFSQDGSPRQILSGYLAARYGYSIDQWRQRYNEIPNAIKDMIRADNEFIKSLPLSWNDDSRVTASMMQDSLMQESDKTGRKPIMVIGDYLQNYQPNAGVKTNTNTERVGKVMEQIYEMVRDDDSYAYLSATQLPKDVDNRENKRPKMGDGKYASEIEEKSELILGLYRDDYYNKSMTKTGEIIVLKKKTGGKDETVTTRFENGLWIPRFGWGEFNSAERDVLSLYQNSYSEVVEI